MSENQSSKAPYLTLGARLKRFREQSQETLAEVAGAVEIDVADLSGFEAGTKRPSEDILELLISHFSVQDKEADKLWKLAGYNEAFGDDELPHANLPTLVVMPVDSRIIYTDNAQITVNQHGVTIDFVQTTGAGLQSKPLVVSRMGMSHQSAANLLKMLQVSLDQLNPKQLPPSDNPKS